MLWRFPVIDGNRHDSGFGGEGIEVIVVLGREWGFGAEAAAVKIDDEGEAL